MSSVLAGREGDAVSDMDEAVTFLPSAYGSARITAVDLTLICIFLIGIYTNYTIQISAKVPFPSAPAGIAGLILLWRRRDRITTSAFLGFVAVELLYLLSILWATDLAFLSRRTNGLLQLTYSLVIGYALFLTVTQATRKQVAGLFLAFAVVILIGCLLEDYAGFRAISDPVRSLLYSSGIYENDLRDVLLYGRVRPKFFASEPASVTFCFSLFTFVWMVTSRHRYKLLIYVGMVAAGLFAMPGPTLLLMLLIVLPYMLFLASRRNGRLDLNRFLKVVAVALVFSIAFLVVGQSMFAERLKQITSGNDASFFYRVRGPAIAGMDIIANYPFAGAGLTGEPFIQDEVIDLYAQSAGFSTGWQIVSPASELLINYFWLHWIYLGLIWGSAIMIALTCWLRRLRVPSAAFCWSVWAIMGQASGAYVGPTCWAVLFLAAAAAVIHQRIDEDIVPAELISPPARQSTLARRLANIRRPHPLQAPPPLIDHAPGET